MTGTLLAPKANEFVIAKVDFWSAPGYLSNLQPMTHVNFHKSAALDPSSPPFPSPYPRFLAFSREFPFP